MLGRLLLLFAVLAEADVSIGLRMLELGYSRAAVAAAVGPIAALYGLGLAKLLKDADRPRP